MKARAVKMKVLLSLPLTVWFVAAQAQPVITCQPANQSVLLGSNAAFGVTVRDSGPVTYLWQFNGSNVLNQIITIAGNGASNTYSGDNGPATNAALNGPSGVCVDAASDVYIADTGNQRIRKVATNGVITTIAGQGVPGYYGDGGPAMNAEFYYPCGLAMDALGRLYISDMENQRIRRINTNNVISTIAGKGTAGYSGDNGAATNAELCDPDGLALDAQGNLYIADPCNQRVRKVATNGIITTLMGNGIAGSNGVELNLPGGVSVDSYGNVYMADSLNNRVRITDATGVYLKTLAGNMIAGFSGDGGPATNAQLLDPNDVAVQSFENFYIADSANNRIRQVTSNGVISTVAGNGIRGFSGDGSIACNASLYKPLSLCLDTGGNLYIADTFNNRVREVSPFATGPILTLNAVPMSEAGSYTVIVSD